MFGIGFSGFIIEQNRSQCVTLSYQLWNQWRIQGGGANRPRSPLFSADFCFLADFFYFRARHQRIWIPGPPPPLFTDPGSASGNRESPNDVKLSHVHFICGCCCCYIWPICLLINWSVGTGGSRGRIGGGGGYKGARARCFLGWWLWQDVQTLGHLQGFPCPSWIQLPTLAQLIALNKDIYADMVAIH